MMRIGPCVAKVEVEVDGVAFCGEFRCEGEVVVEAVDAVGGVDPDSEAVAVGATGGEDVVEGKGGVGEGAVGVVVGGEEGEGGDVVAGVEGGWGGGGMEGGGEGCGEEGEEGIEGGQLGEMHVGQ